MDGTKPWAENLIPLDDDAAESLNGLVADPDSAGDVYEGGILSYIIPALFAGAIVYAVVHQMNKKKEI